MRFEAVMQAITIPYDIIQTCICAQELMRAKGAANAIPLCRLLMRYLYPNTVVV